MQMEMSIKAIGLPVDKKEMVYLLTVLLQLYTMVLGSMVKSTAMEENHKILELILSHMLDNFNLAKGLGTDKCLLIMRVRSLTLTLENSATVFIMERANLQKVEELLRVHLEIIDSMTVD